MIILLRVAAEIDDRRSRSPPHRTRPSLGRSQRLAVRAGHVPLPDVHVDPVVARRARWVRLSTFNLLHHARPVRRPETRACQPRAAAVDCRRRGALQHSLFSVTKSHQHANAPCLPPHVRPPSCKQLVRFSAIPSLLLAVLLRYSSTASIEPKLGASVPKERRCARTGCY